MHASQNILLTRSRLDEIRTEPVRVVGAALAVLLGRYGVEQSARYRWPDGSSSPVPVSDHVDDDQRVWLFRVGGGNGLTPLSVEVAIQPPGRAQPTLGLTFTAAATRNSLEVSLDGDDAWSTTGIDVRHILGHIGTLIAACDAEPERLLGTVDILTVGERHLLLETYNGREVSYPATTLHQLFASQAALTPDAIAVVDGARSVSYRQLDLATNRVAHQIRPHISRPGQVVAVSGIRSEATLVAKIGVMKAGGAFMYLPPDAPASRVALMCDIGDPCCIVSTAAIPLGNGSRPQILLDDLLKNSRASETAIEEIAGPTSAAYVLFTSGSTGEPKGVVRSHRMNTTRIALEQGLYGLGVRDRYLMKSIPFFREVFVPLATGGTIVVARHGGELDDAYLIDLIRQQGVTICSFVPSMLRVLLGNPCFRETSLPIRHLFVAGEVLDDEMERRLRELGLAVHVTYTLAEADYVSHRSGPPPIDARLPDVGRPIDMRLYVCDPKGRLLPPGFVGEFLTGGPGLADGYVNRLELTKERFVANVFDPDRAAYLFRTGDLGRFRADGQVEFAGRADTQLKIRGQRVEPTEVEIAIGEHAQVKQVIVTSIQDEGESHLLVAYMVAKFGNLDVKSLRSFLEQRLPAYMIPSYLVQVPTLPQLASGKTDRARLRALLTARPAHLGPPRSPEDELERRIAGVWSRVLGVDEVGIDDPFTALGGDSLRLMLLRQALELELGTPIDLVTLISAGTVREIAEHFRGEP
jgi:amino acid adenylation domain-containing protein